MPTPRYRYRFQLQDRSLGDFAGPPITGAGGVVRACVAGSPLWAALTDKSGASITNPVSLTRGSAEFYSVEAALDLFIQCPDGQFVDLWSVGPDEMHEVPVDRSRRDQVMVIPVHITNYAAAVETATGFTEPSEALFTADAVSVNVIALDATETLDVGTATAASGDPDGFISAIDIGAALGVVKDNGALFSSGAAHISTSKSIVVTTTAGSDTLVCYVFLPYTLVKVNAPTLN